MIFPNQPNFSILSMVLQFLKSSYQAVTRALKKTRSFFGDRLLKLFSGPINEEVVDQLEELFYEADFGVKLSRDLTEKTRQFLRKKKDSEASDVLAFIQSELTEVLKPFDYSLKEAPLGTPTVILIVGTNGNGKTTFIAKLAKELAGQGKKVLLAAGDTFRAGAQEQLTVWAKRIPVDIVSSTYMADPAAVVFDAATAAKARAADYLIIDTAGRLENKTHLMHELEKMKRSLAKVIPGSPHETLLVLDATIGQNGMQYAQTFQQFTPLTGIVLTKVDGTAKGGHAIAIQTTMGLPVKFLGTGEGIEDLAAFEPHTFVKSLFSDEQE